LWFTIPSYAFCLRIQTPNPCDQVSGWGSVPTQKLFWKNLSLEDNVKVNASGLAQATRRGNSNSAMLRLSHRLLEHLGNPENQFTIAVHGNSIAMGHGLDSSVDAWPAQLQDALGWLGFGNIKVINFGEPSSTSEKILSKASAYQQMSEFASVDLHLVDYTFSDVPPILGLQSITQVENITREVIQFFLSQPLKPAVVYLETFVSFEYNALCQNCAWGFNCLHAPEEFPHWKVLQELQVPTITYSDLVCPHYGTEASAGWSGVDSIHPRKYVHQAIANTVAASLIQWAEEWCASPHEHPAEALVAPSSAAYKCSMNAILDFNAVDGVFPALNPGSWVFEEDVPGKPGWIATGVVSDIVFDLPLIETDDTFAVRLTFLQTYENIGTATCWLNDGFDGLEALSGRIEAHVSVPIDHVFTGKLSHGSNKLTCRSDGRKFKITGLRVCVDKQSEG